MKERSKLSVMNVLFCCYAMVSLVWDVRRRLLPNRWIAAGIIATVILHIWFDGWTGLWLCVLGAVMGTMFTIPLWAVGAIGAGDAKWFLVAGAWVGGTVAGAILLASIGLSGLVAVGYFVLSRHFRQRCFEMSLLMISILHAPSPGTQIQALHHWGKRGDRFPFMIAVFPSIGIVFAVQRWVPGLLEVWG
jgi:prepilin peptidase CpaA